MRVVSDLLCEWAWSGARVSAAVLRRTSALGTLCAALARPGDTVWTPLPIDAGRVVPGPGLPRVEWESGELASLAPRPTLAWGETEATARSRIAECALRPAASSAHWLDFLRSLRAPTVETQRRVADRRRQLAFARSTGRALAGARVAGCTADVLGSPAALRGDRWVAKAPWSASGRERLRGRGSELSDADRTRLARLLATHGELIVEPWMERTADFGALGIAHSAGMRVVGVHRVLTTGGGTWAGIRPLGDDEFPEGLDAAETRELLGALRDTGDWLRSEGYEGAFGIDAWRVRDADGALRLHALGEVNARLTFGFVARRLAEGAGWDERSGRRAPELRVGDAEQLRAAVQEAVILLHPGDDGVAAWIA